MKNKLEQLLNSLIEKGWCPRWEDKIHSCRYYDEEKKFKADYTRAWIPQVLYRSLTELCSKSSWLWQFVCENGMVFVPKWEIPYVERNYIFDYEHYDISDFQYWLMVWALLKEDELEQFLLDNIIINEQA